MSLSSDRVKLSKSACLRFVLPERGTSGVLPLELAQIVIASLYHTNRELTLMLDSFIRLWLSISD